MIINFLSLLQSYSYNLIKYHWFIIFFFYQILSVFQERGVICEEVQRFEDLLMQQRELFAEEEVRYSFPKLITFVLTVSKIFPILAVLTWFLRSLFVLQSLRNDFCNSI